MIGSATARRQGVPVRAPPGRYRSCVQRTWARTGRAGARPPRRTGGSLGALVATLVSALLAGCTATEGPTSGVGARPASDSAASSVGSPSPSATVRASASPSGPAAGGTAVGGTAALTSGALTLTLRAERPTITAQPDGSVQASIPLPAELPADAAQLAAPPGTTF